MFIHEIQALILQQTKGCIYQTKVSSVILCATLLLFQ